MRRVILIMMTVGILPGCAAIGPVIGALSAGYSIAEKISDRADKLIRAGCAEYDKEKSLAYARLALGAAPAMAGPKLLTLASFGDAACANPPDGDPLDTAIWLGGLAKQMHDAAKP